MKKHTESVHSESVHFIGIGGAGMSGIARVLARQGVHVTGSDLRESPVLEALRSEGGIHAVAGHAASNLNGATLVVASAAVKKDNPEIVAARGKGLPVVSRAEMLGRLMARYRRSVAVSGTHGKTTTSAMTALVCEAAGLDPTVLLGGDLPAFGGNARLGASDVFVAEACEAYDSFLDLDPAIAVITNVEADHLDYYGDLDNVLRSFRKFLSQVSGTAIFCGDDENVTRLAQEMRGRRGAARVLRAGLQGGADVQAVCIEQNGPAQTFDVVHGDGTLGRVTLRVPGLHNVTNALGAVAVGLTLGASWGDIARGLEAFTGTGRRFEILGESGGVLVVDDYAHHPTEIRATLAAACAAYPGRRVVAVFQPHLPSRTRDFLENFAEAFADADFVVLTDIYLAREEPLPGLTGATLAALTADRRGAEHVTYVADKAALPARLLELTQPGDLVLTLGAGDIRAAGEGFLHLLNTSVATDAPSGDASRAINYPSGGPSEDDCV